MPDINYAKETNIVKNKGRVWVWKKKKKAEFVCWSKLVFPVWGEFPYKQLWSQVPSLH